MTLMHRIGLRVLAGSAAVLAAGVWLGGVTPREALAQNALGDGRALDANLHQGSGGRNFEGRDYSSEIALRNAIVTGNVGGGRSFRGDVGYTATDDFRGTLGSNDLFIWNRESAYSGLAAQNLRGIGALQFQLGQVTAGMTKGLNGDLIIRRAGGGIDSGAVIGTPAPRATATIDPYGHVKASLRSTSDFLVRSTSFPKMLTALGDDASGATYLTASPLQGVKPLGLRNSALGLSLDLEQLGANSRLVEDSLKIPGQRAATKSDEEDVGGLRPISQRVGSDTVHQMLLQDLEARQRAFQPDALGRRLGEPAPERGVKEQEQDKAPGAIPEPEAELSSPSDDSLTARLDKLRNEFATAQEMPWQREEREQRELDAEERRKEANERLRQKLDPSDPLSAANDVRMAEDEDRTEMEAIVREARETLGRMPTALDTLIAEEGTNDLYTVHMRKGQALLLEEKWFSAEERFAAALRARAGDPMAAAGRISAEIGAGLYRSAAINLRMMLTAYPEMLQTRLEPKLFPSGERLERVRAQLRLRSELDTPVARDVGFLLAYVGSQTGNSVDLNDGFAIMHRVDKAMNSSFDKLETVAQALWMNP